MVRIFLAILIFSMPFSVQAVTSDEIRMEILDLFKRISAIQTGLGGAQIDTQGNLNSQYGDYPPEGSGSVGDYVLPNSYGDYPNDSYGDYPIEEHASSPGGLFNYSGCPNLKYDMQIGALDRNVAFEVSMLQRFLAQDSSLYPEKIVSGWFGPATHRAIQKFQVRHGIVNVGDYNTSGYGRAGPRTRWAIKNSCGTGGSVPKETFEVSPSYGSAPLNVEVSFDGAGSTCTSALIDWGDGTAPFSYNAPSPKKCSKDKFTRKATHTYTNPGTYKIVLRMGNETASRNPKVAEASVTVAGSGFGGTQNTIRSTMSITPSGGTPPLSVRLDLGANSGTSCTSYYIDWGDGTSPVLYNSSKSQYCSRDIFSKSFTHTYTTSGNYNVEARASSGSLTNAEPLHSIVSVSANGTSNNVYSNTGCFVSPVTGYAPLQASARIPLGGTLCDGRLTYQIDWGDGQATASKTCINSASHLDTINHTYTNNGQFIARLVTQHPQARFDDESCTVVVGGGGTTGGNGGTGGSNSSDSISTSSISIVNNAYSVSFSFTLNSSASCNGGDYVLDFGDGSYSNERFPADECRSITRNTTHTFTKNGNYTVKLIDNKGTTTAQTQISVSGLSAKIPLKSSMASVLVGMMNAVGELFGR